MWAIHAIKHIERQTQATNRHHTFNIASHCTILFVDLVNWFWNRTRELWTTVLTVASSMNILVILSRRLKLNIILIHYFGSSHCNCSWVFCIGLSQRCETTIPNNGQLLICAVLLSQDKIPNIQNIAPLFIFWLCTIRKHNGRIG